MNRRGFLGAILAAASAPAIVKASSIMQINPDKGIYLLNMDAYQFRDGTLVHGYDLARAGGDFSAETAMRLSRDGRIGMVENFNIIQSRLDQLDRNIKAVVERDLQEKFGPPIIVAGSFEDFDPKIEPWKIWQVREGKPFWGPAMPELMDNMKLTNLLP